MIGIPYYILKFLRTQYLPLKRIKEIQEKGLKAILKHAYQHVPFYHFLWKKLKINPSDISLNKLDNLPLISKEDVLRNFSSFFALNYAKSEKSYVTSGTLGTPTQFFYDNKAWDIAQAIYYRCMHAAGYDFKKPLAIYYFKHPGKSFFGLARKIFIPSYFSEKSQLSLIRNLKPPYLHYFPSVLFSLARIAEKEHFEFDFIKSIITTGEVITRKIKEEVEAIFNSKVFDHYAAAEFGRIAFQCENGLYHINSDILILESLNGEAVLTSLTNYLMPLIRYKLGDLVKLYEGPCSCKRKLPCLEKINGKKANLIRLRSGKLFTEKQVIDALSSIKGFSKILVKYYGLNKFKILFVGLDAENLEEKVKKNLYSLFKEEIKVKFKEVKEIPKTPGGKRPFVRVYENTGNKLLQSI